MQMKRKQLYRLYTFLPSYLLYLLVHVQMLVYSSVKELVFVGNAQSRYNLHETATHKNTERN